jgi:hypothetical protein
MLTVRSESLLWGLGVFLGMLLLLEVGRRVGAWRLAADPEGARTGVGAVEGAVYGLLGLLLAFSFSGAAARLDIRRQQIVEEANAIGTAWLRLDLLPGPARAELRDTFRKYLDTRLRIYRSIPDMDAVKLELDRSAVLQQKIWTGAVSAALGEGAPAQAAIVVLPALNEMIDLTTTRTMATKMHPPEIVFIMLVLLALVSALLVGYGMAGSKRRSWIHMLAYTGFMTVTLFVVLDLEFPRRGFIRVDDFDQVLVELRKSMDVPG